VACAFFASGEAFTLMSTDRAALAPPLFSKPPCEVYQDTDGEWQILTHKDVTAFWDKQTFDAAEHGIETASGKRVNIPGKAARNRWAFVDIGYVIAKAIEKQISRHTLIRLLNQHIRNKQGESEIALEGYLFEEIYELKEDDKIIGFSLPVARDGIPAFAIDYALEKDKEKVRNDIRIKGKWIDLEYDRYLNTPIEFNDGTIVYVNIEESRHEIFDRLAEMNHDAQNGLFPVVSGMGIYEKNDAFTPELAEIVNLAKGISQVSENRPSRTDKPKKLEKFLDHLKNLTVHAQFNFHYYKTRQILEDAFEKLPDRIKNASYEVLSGGREVPAKTIFADLVVSGLFKARCALKDFFFPAGKSTQAVRLNELIDTISPYSVKDYEDEFLIINTDETALVRAIANISQNAEDAIGRNNGGDYIIKTLVDEEKEIAKIIISDTAGGISEERLQTIFDRGVSSYYGKHKGLGLAIAKECIEKRCDGTLSVESEEGIGTTFTIILPLKDPEIREEERIDHYANQLIRWMITPENKKHLFPVKPIWHSDGARLGEKNDRGEIITLTPEVALKIVELTNGAHQITHPILKESVRHEAGINRDSKEWVYLDRYFNFPFKGIEMGDIVKEFVACDEDERRFIFRALEKYKSVGIDMMYDADVWQGPGGTDLFMYGFFGKGWEGVFWMAGKECGDMREEVQKTAMRLGGEVFAMTRIAGGMFHFRKGRVKLAKQLFAIALEKGPTIAPKLGGKLGETAVLDEEYTRTCAQIAYSYKHLGVWESFKQTVEDNSGSVEVDVLSPEDYHELGLKNVRTGDDLPAAEAALLTASQDVRQLWRAMNEHLFELFKYEFERWDRMLKHVIENSDDKKYIRTYCDIFKEYADYFEKRYTEEGQDVFKLAQEFRENEEIKNLFNSLYGDLFCHRILYNTYIILAQRSESYSRGKMSKQDFVADIKKYQDLVKGVLEYLERSAEGRRVVPGATLRVRPPTKMQTEERKYSAKRLRDLDAVYYREYPYHNVGPYNNVESEVALPESYIVKNKDAVITLAGNLDDRSYIEDFGKLQFEDIETHVASELKGKAGNCHQGHAVFMQLEHEDDVVGTMFVSGCDVAGGKVVFNDKTYLFVYHYDSTTQNKDFYAFIKWLLKKTNAPEKFECYIADYQTNRGLKQITEQLCQEHPEITVDVIDDWRRKGMVGLTVSAYGVTAKVAGYDRKLKGSDWVDPRQVKTRPFKTTPIENLKDWIAEQIVENRDQLIRRLNELIECNEIQENDIRFVRQIAEFFRHKSHSFEFILKMLEEENRKDLFNEFLEGLIYLVENFDLRIYHEKIPPSLSDKLQIIAMLKSDTGYEHRFSHYRVAKYLLTKLKRTDVTDYRKIQDLIAKGKSIFKSSGTMQFRILEQYRYYQEGWSSVLFLNLIVKELEGLLQFNQECERVLRDVKAPDKTIQDIVKAVSETKEELNGIKKERSNRVRDLNSPIDTDEAVKVAEKEKERRRLLTSMEISVTNALTANKRLTISSLDFEYLVDNLIDNTYYAQRDDQDKIKVDVKLSEKHEGGKTYLNVVVSDDGIGMEDDLLERIRKGGGITTRPKGIGSGKGIPIVFGIVKKYGGVIKIDSELGKGTTFDILLPIQEEEDGAAVPEVYALPFPTDEPDVEVSSESYEITKPEQPNDSQEDSVIDEAEQKIVDALDTCPAELDMVAISERAGISQDDIEPLLSALVETDLIRIDNGWYSSVKYAEAESPYSNNTESIIADLSAMKRISHDSYRFYYGCAVDIAKLFNIYRSEPGVSTSSSGISMSESIKKMYEIRGKYVHDIDSLCDFWEDHHGDIDSAEVDIEVLKSDIMLAFDIAIEWRQVFEDRTKINLSKLPAKAQEELKESSQYSLSLAQNYIRLMTPIANALKDEAEKAKEIITENEKTQATIFEDAVKLIDEPTIIALGTNWITGYNERRYPMHHTVNPLLTFLEGYCEDHKIPLIVDRDENLMGRIEIQKEISGYENAKVLVLAGEDIAWTVQNELENAFSIGVDSKNLLVDNYIRLMEMLTVLMELSKEKKITPDVIRRVRAQDARSDV